MSKREVSPQFSVCECVCECVCVLYGKGSSRYETVFVFLFGWFFILGPGGVLVNSNRKNSAVCTHRVLESTFSLLVCVIYQAFLGKYLFL